MDITKFVQMAEGNKEDLLKPENMEQIHQGLKERNRLRAQVKRKFVEGLTDGVKRFSYSDGNGVEVVGDGSKTLAKALEELVEESIAIAESR